MPGKFSAHDRLGLLIDLADHSMRVLVGQGCAKVDLGGKEFDGSSRVETWVESATARRRPTHRQPARRVANDWARKCTLSQSVVSLSTVHFVTRSIRNATNGPSSIAHQPHSQDSSCLSVVLVLCGTGNITPVLQKRSSRAEFVGAITCSSIVARIDHVPITSALSVILQFFLPFFTSTSAHLITKCINSVISWLTTRACKNPNH